MNNPNIFVDIQIMRICRIFWPMFKLCEYFKFFADIQIMWIFLIFPKVLAIDAFQNFGKLYNSLFIGKYYNFMTALIGSFQSWMHIWISFFSFFLLFTNKDEDTRRKFLLNLITNIFLGQNNTMYKYQISYSFI